MKQFIFIALAICVCNATNCQNKYFLLNGNIVDHNFLVATWNPGDGITIRSDSNDTVRSINRMKVITIDTLDGIIGIKLLDEKNNIIILTNLMEIKIKKGEIINRNHFIGKVNSIDNISILNLSIYTDSKLLTKDETIKYLNTRK